VNMAVRHTAAEAAPAIALRQVAAERDSATGHWSIAWVIENKNLKRIEILAVRLPHGKFKSEEHRFAPALQLEPGASSRFQLCVSCDEPAGLVTENAFVIFSVIRSGEALRVFVRLRVVVNPGGKLETATELITTQKVGFSGVIS